MDGEFEAADLETKKGNQRMTKGDWIAAARAALIAGGIEQVKVDRLARDLNITRGSFYWFFKNRDELLDALLKDWERNNSKPLFDAIATAPANDGRAQFTAMMGAWLDEVDYSPAYDSAVRDWARNSEAVERAVRRVDNKRIAAIDAIFQTLGYEKEEAFIRARVTYFHQVGYYALHIKESRAAREKLRPLYFKALTGLDLD